MGHAHAAGHALCRSLSSDNHHGRGVCGVQFHVNPAKGTEFHATKVGGKPAMGIQRWQELCVAMLEALRAMHCAGIIHGDVKLANFCVSDRSTLNDVEAETPRVEVIDFGFSRRASIKLDVLRNLRTHFEGTADYASRSMLECKPFTFADDLGA